MEAFLSVSGVVATLFKFRLSWVKETVYAIKTPLLSQLPLCCNSLLGTTESYINTILLAYIRHTAA